MTPDDDLTSRLEALRDWLTKRGCIEYAETAEEALRSLERDRGVGEWRDPNPLAIVANRVELVV